MKTVKINAGPFAFTARFETEMAPGTCAFFESLMPFRQKLVHCRWSGEGCWVPLGDLPSNIAIENATSYPAPGQLIFYRGGYSKAELLLAYGSVCFASKIGQLAGNHLMTITSGIDNLAELGRLTLWEGAQNLAIDLE
ncbi:MAG TPA: DUF3830 family protein [Candidatus Baltobacteraceae bacterium]|jgi:hypothetical protein|nr:DUF3830 family protein [Candidatus Baltobacteraceae bacterium]